MEGLADLSENDPDLVEIATQIGGRYMGAHRAEEGVVVASDHEAAGARHSPPDRQRMFSFH